MARVAIDVVRAWGHENVSARHRTTIEITRDDYLTPRGDCIVGIKADKGLANLNPELREVIRRDGSIVLVIFIAGDVVDYVVGQGSENLTLNDPNRLIIRRSSYINDSTLMIRSNKAAIDLRRDLVDRLKRGSELTVVIVGVDPHEQA
ncbi:DUF371 domain-containing protein [Vulcanisaeta thermophila]|uniref:DUF371 domain-containing protein n=1 Tax=Vulcanisaeta thermophila TaxID=867917 RepID=UPI000853BC2E|nr:DUF371 domain-containing protein [Vulcanisaeta thermophila]